MNVEELAKDMADGWKGKFCGSLVDLGKRRYLGDLQISSRRSNNWRGNVMGEGEDGGTGGGRKDGRMLMMNDDEEEGSKEKKKTTNRILRIWGGGIKICRELR